MAAPAIAIFMLVARLTMRSPTNPAAQPRTTKYFRPNKSLPLEKTGASTAVQTATDCDSQTALPLSPRRVEMFRPN